MHTFGISENKETYHKLINAYSEKHRHYHTNKHISVCLKHLNTVKQLADKPKEIELALWFHDAIYKPTSSHNELDSANWATEFLKDNNVNQSIIDRVFKLIMVTLHDCSTQTIDESLMVDIDLTILGASPNIYQIFEENIRKEYKWVPYFHYRKKRKEVLQGFLNKNKIYHTQYFFELYEILARKNIHSAIATL